MFLWFLKSSTEAAQGNGITGLDVDHLVAISGGDAGKCATQEMPFWCHPKFKDQGLDKQWLYLNNKAKQGRTKPLPGGGGGVLDETSIFCQNSSICVSVVFSLLALKRMDFTTGHSFLFFPGGLSSWKKLCDFAQFSNCPPEPIKTNEVHEFLNFGLQ